MSEQRSHPEKDHRSSVGPVVLTLLILVGIVALFLFLNWFSAEQVDMSREQGAPAPRSSVVLQP